MKRHEIFHDVWRKSNPAIGRFRIFICALKCATIWRNDYENLERMTRDIKACLSGDRWEATYDREPITKRES